MTNDVDVLVVGGGAAGLSGAKLLARSRRSVLVIDAGHPRNEPAEGAHNVLGAEGLAPTELYATGRRELEQYGGVVRTGIAREATRTEGGFAVTLDDGNTVTARRLLVTSGLTDELPDVPGLADHWGRDVLHCPFCHGWEVRDQRIGVLATDPVAAVHQGLLFRQLSETVVVLRNGVDLGEDAAKLAAWDIDVVDGRVVEILTDGGRVSGVRLENGESLSLQAIVVRPRFRASSQLLESLGLGAEQTEFDARYPAEPVGVCAVPGVYLAGNVTDPMATVASAAAQGAMAASAIHADLMAADTAERLERAVPWVDRSSAVCKSTES